MPHIWLTYEELSEHFQCSVSAAREGVIRNHWPRRKCTDQLTRVKVPQALAHEVIMAYAAKLNAQTSADEMVAELREVLALAKRAPAVAAADPVSHAS